MSTFYNYDVNRHCGTLTSRHFLASLTAVLKTDQKTKWLRNRLETVPLFCGYRTVNFLVSFFYAHKRPSPLFYIYPIKTLFWDECRLLAGNSEIGQSSPPSSVGLKSDGTTGQTTGHLEVDMPRATVPSLSTCDGCTTGHWPVALFMRQDRR